MDLLIEFPDAMPKGVRDQIVLESKAMAQGVLGDYTFTPCTTESLSLRLIQNFAKMKVNQYKKINEANESSNSTVTLYQNKVDELKAQVESLKRQIK